MEHVAHFLPKSPSWLIGSCLLSVLYILFALLQTIRVAYKPGLREIPGPWLAPYTNLPLKFATLSGTRSRYIHALHQHYGPFVRISPDEIAIASLPASCTIHSIKDGFVKGPWYGKLARFLVDPALDGIFTMRSKSIHAQRRKLFASAFSHSSLLRWEPLIKSKAATAVSAIRASALSGKADVLKTWTLMSNDMIAALAFGEDFGALAAGERTPFITDLVTSMITGGMTAEFPWIAYLPLPAFKVWERLIAKGEIAVCNTLAAPDKTLFAKMMAEGEKGALRRETIATEAFNFCIAGTDTTSLALTYFVWAVLRDERIKSKLLAEVLPLSDDPSARELEELPYLNCVIDEVLRLYTPISQSLPRTVPEGGVTFSDYYIPAGTTVSTQAYTLHRDPSIFSDPLTFNPDRWDEGSVTKEMRDAFMAWGAGSRGCLGIHLAKIEIRFAAVAFLGECKGARVLSTEAEMDYWDFFMVAPKGGRCEITMVGEK